MWPGQSFRGCRGAGRCSSRPASRSEDNQPAVFADSRPPHSHSLAACRALQAIRALKALQGSSALVDPERFSLDAQLLCQIILVVLLLFMLCILLHCLALFDTFWKCCQQGRNSPSHHLCHQLKAIVLLNPYYCSKSFH